MIWKCPMCENTNNTEICLVCGRTLHEASKAIVIERMGFPYNEQQEESFLRVIKSEENKAKDVYR